VASATPPLPPHPPTPRGKKEGRGEGI